MKAVGFRWVSFHACSLATFRTDCLIESLTVRGFKTRFSFRRYCKNNASAEIVFSHSRIDACFCLSEALGVVVLTFAALETGLKLFFFKVIWAYGDPDWHQRIKGLVGPW